MPKLATCTNCNGTGHGGEECTRENRVFGCEVCDGLGEVEAEDGEEQGS